MNRPSIAFLFLGGAHQTLHIAPVALELDVRGVATVRLLAAGEAEREAVVRYWQKRGLAAPPVELLPQPVWTRLLSLGRTRSPAAKLIGVLAARRLLASFDAVVAAERTCTILKRLPGPKPYLIHIPHGAGDRAKGFEPRISLFDHVIVAGEKDRERLVAEGICRAADVSVSGYVKLAAVRGLAVEAGRPKLFTNDNPVVLYNPHFAPELSSWRRFAEPLIAAFANQQDFNLIVAPHVRLFESASPRERRAVEALALPGQIRIDLGSPSSSDMTYTLAADLYVGDVSSQVYEFLQQPKPCVFLDAGVGDWQCDPSFAFWNLGEVVSDPGDVLAAVVRAPGLHPQFLPRQLHARDQALGPVDPSPIATAAHVVETLATAQTRKIMRRGSS
jgi:hypothetical protein